MQCHIVRTASQQCFTYFYAVTQRFHTVEHYDELRLLRQIVEFRTKSTYARLANRIQHRPEEMTSIVKRIPKAIQVNTSWQMDPIGCRFLFRFI